MKNQRGAYAAQSILSKLLAGTAISLVLTAPVFAQTALPPVQVQGQDAGS